MLILPKFKPARPGVEMVVESPLTLHTDLLRKSDWYDATDDENDPSRPFNWTPWHNPVLGIYSHVSERFIIEVGKAYQPKPGWTRPGWWWFAAGDDRLQAVCPDEIGWHWGLTAWEDAKTAVYPDGKTDPRNHLRNNGFFPVHVRVLDILGLEAGQWQIKVLVLPINYVYDKPLTEEQW